MAKAPATRTVTGTVSAFVADGYSAIAELRERVEEFEGAEFPTMR